jgi:hypothetical protein
MSGEALARAVTAWSSTRGTARVSSVGINRWAETTFAVAGGATGIGAKHDRLLTFDADGAPTSGDEGYASDPRGPFPVSEVRPDVLARVLRKIRSGQPGTVLLAAILTAGPFSHTLQWHVTVVSEVAGSSLVYEAAPDGSGLCHGPDVVDDALVASSEIPPCAGPVHSGYFLTR